MTTNELTAGSTKGDPGPSEIRVVRRTSFFLTKENLAGSPDPFGDEVVAELSLDPGDWKLSGRVEYDTNSNSGIACRMQLASQAALDVHTEWMAPTPGAFPPGRTYSAYLPASGSDTLQLVCSGGFLTGHYQRILAVSNIVLEAQLTGNLAVTDLPDVDETR